VIIDPGIGVVDQLEAVLAEHRLRPAAVLLTHGHIDHTFSVVPVCGAREIPAFIHPKDRPQLADPWSGFGAAPGTPLFGSVTFSEPEDVRELHDGETLHLAGVELSVQLAPGHTEGSLAFGVQTPEAPVLFSGDLLFAGSIGRVDLPGGSAEAMLDSLARVVLPMDDATVVKPGHGPDTTIARERVTNPYLLQVADPRAPRTGL
jgi:glyoxylase-like metal-dependent hydrolase (beta-lactamase superfamily II)